MTVMQQTRLGLGVGLAPPGNAGASSARPRVLVDLSHTADGYVGVAQDTRMNFALLTSLPELETAGLLMAAGVHDLPRIRPDMPEAAAATAAVLHWMARNWEVYETKSFPRSLPQIISERRRRLRRHHGLLRVANEGQRNVIWRTLFDKTLLPQERVRVTRADFFATDLSVSRLIGHVLRGRGWEQRLDTRGFDYALFCMPRPIRLPAGTRPLMRFHDAVPVTDTDSIVDWRHGMAHQRLVLACDKEAVFVCDSPQSLRDLIALDPSRERLARVVPCTLAPARPAVASLSLPTIVRRRATFRVIGQEEAPTGWTAPSEHTRYLLAVSTLEPRKNYPGLIRAWERLLLETDPELRLVIVAGRGWRDAEIVRQMRPGVESGRLLHLENVPGDELQTLMAGSACFVAASFNEGFGYTPLEALQAGAVCVVSDLPAFRWVLGNAALYADPYDIEHLATQIRRLVYDPDREGLREAVDTARDRVIARFSPGSVRDQWANLFDDLQRERRAIPGAS